MNRLTEAIKLAISNKDVVEMKKLIDVCDSLHRGIHVDEYEMNEIPDDCVYEELKHNYENLTEVGRIHQQLSSEIVKSTYIKAKPKRQLSEFNMMKDAIIKSNIVNAKMFGNRVIVMPKYDGVSCCIKFDYNESKKEFEVVKARTRGVDVGIENVNTDMTERIKQILYSTTCPWIKRLNNLAKKFKSITIRGEVVLIRKLETSPAQYVAGKINSKFERIDAENVIGFKMFEITRCYDKDNEYILTQSKACEIFKKVDSSLVYEYVDLTNNQEENDKLMLSIFDKWKETLSSPIDGIVYCKPDWKYPLYKEETGVNYNKFALKPYETLTSKLTSVYYNISKDGKLIPMICFEPVNSNYRNYKQACSTIHEINEMITKKNLSVGSVLNITFPGSIPHINDACLFNDTTQKISLPKKCPFCNSKIELSVKNDKNVLICSNNNCHGIHTKLLLQLMKNIKAKGVGESKIVKALNTSDANYIHVFSIIDKLMKTTDFVKSHIYDSTVSGLFIGLDIYTAENIRKDINLSSILNNKVSDERLTVKNELLKHNKNIIIDTVIKYL